MCLLVSLATVLCVCVLLAGAEDASAPVAHTRQDAVALPWPVLWPSCCILGCLGRSGRRWRSRIGQRRGLQGIRNEEWREEEIIHAPDRTGKVEQ